MGACGCVKSYTAEEEYLSFFWNSVQIKNLTAEQLIEKTVQLKFNTNEEFFKAFEEKIIDVYFKSEETTTIVEYLVQNSLSIVSGFKALSVFFSLLLICDFMSEKSFTEAFKRFFQLCSKFPEVSALNLNDKYLIQEFVIFYVYLVSAQTHKAFLQSPNAPHFEKSRKEFNSIYSQRNRDAFVESLFSYYHRNEFSLFSFAIENLKKLQHSNVRASLEEIESKNVAGLITK